MTKREFLSKIKEYNENYNMDLISRAYDIAEEMHRNQLRKSGEEYLIHPVAVAEILAEVLNSGEWQDDANKIAFLIFDAPPHYGSKEEEMILNAVNAAAYKGIHVVPVVASNAERETELFGRALSIMTNSNYVFLTDDSGVGGSHLEPIIGSYEVELLHDIIVRNINEIAG